MLTLLHHTLLVLIVQSNCISLPTNDVQELPKMSGFSNGTTTCSEGSYLFGHECLPCRSCDAGHVEVRGCSGANDALCECSPGFYESAEGICTSCSTCARGHFVEAECAHANNRKCEMCVNGTFSAWTNAPKCTPCTKCTGEEDMLKSCSSEENTLCVNVKRKFLAGSQTSFPPFLLDVNNSILSNDVTSQSSARKPKTSVVYIYCSLMVAIIVAVSVYVIVRHKRIVKQKKKAKMMQVSESHARDQNFAMERTKVKHLSDADRERLENQICKVPDAYPLWQWEDFARGLGYDQEAIRYFQAQSAGEDHTPLRILTRSYLSKGDSTILQLSKVLAAFKRTDVLSLLNKLSSCQEKKTFHVDITNLDTPLLMPFKHHLSN